MQVIDMLEFVTQIYSESGHNALPCFYLSSKPCPGSSVGRAAGLVAADQYSIFCGFESHTGQ